eukprot:136766_1
MANHYHKCVKVNVFDKNGYFLEKRNQRKRLFSQTTTQNTAPNAKKQKCNEEEEEYDDLSYSDITPNQYKKYEQLLLTDKQWQLVNKDNMKRKKHKSTLKKAKAVQSRCIKSKFGGFVKENKVKYDIIQKIEIIHNITDTSDPQFNTLYKDYDKYNKRNGFTKTPQTREWGSTFKLYENQIKYKKHIKRTLDSDQIEKTKQYLKPTLKNKTNIKKIIEDEQHWNDMQEYLDKYELIRERLIKSQGDVNVSDIEYHFHRVQAKYEDEEYKYYDARTAESVKKRFELIEDDIHFAGKITDPRRVGEAIDIDDYEKGIRYLKLHFGEEEWENKWQDIFVLFEDHDGIFAKRQLLNMNDHNMFDAINWWSYFQRFKIKSNGNTLELKPFCKVMIKIAKVLGTNAKMEST